MSKKKRRLSVNWDKCLCHSYSSSGGNLELFTQKSWGRLCMAAKRRQDDRCVLKEYIIREVELPRDVNVLLKHQSCYAATLEKSVHLCETRRNRHCEDKTEGGRVSARGGGDPPPLSTTGGNIPPCWQENLKYFPYFTVISVKICHFKHQNLKTLIFSETIRDAAEKRGDRQIMLVAKTQLLVMFGYAVPAVVHIHTRNIQRATIMYTMVGLVMHIIQNLMLKQM